MLGPGRPIFLIQIIGVLLGAIDDCFHRLMFRPLINPFGCVDGWHPEVTRKAAALAASPFTRCRTTGHTAVIYTRQTHSHSCGVYH